MPDLSPRLQRVWEQGLANASRCEVCGNRGLVVDFVYHGTPLLHCDRCRRAANADPDLRSARFQVFRHLYELED